MTVAPSLPNWTGDRGTPGEDGGREGVEMEKGERADKGKEIGSGRGKKGMDEDGRDAQGRRKRGEKLEGRTKLHCMPPNLIRP